MDFGTKNYKDAERYEGVIDRTCSLPSLTDITSIDEGLCLKDNHFVHSDVSISDIDLNSGCFEKHGSAFSTKDSLFAATESEGYSSLLSNSSTQSSPCASSQTSPVSDELIASIYDSCLPNDSDKFQLQITELVETDNAIAKKFKSICCSDEDIGDSGKQGSLGKQLSVENNLPECTATNSLSDSSNGRVLFDLSKKRAACESSMAIEPPAMEISLDANQHDSVEHTVERNSEHSVDETRKMDILLRRRMSTIEEGTEDTPSPRSNINIDAEFKYALRSLERKNPKDLCEESNESEDEKMEESCDRQNQNSSLSEDVPDEKVISVDLRDGYVAKSRPQAEYSLHHELPNELDTQNYAVNEEAIDDFLVNEKILDIDLDTYDIPMERRRSLEIKLDDLRDFVSKILEERKDLEKDRALLKDALTIINAQRHLEDDGKRSEIGYSVSGAKEDVSDHAKVLEGHMDRGKGNEETEDSLQKNKCDKHADGVELLVGEEGTFEGCTIGMNGTKLATCTSSEYEELIFSLEEALLENTDLKNENLKLSKLNEELQNRIEELLTEEEEVQYRMNEETLKLMEESQRQRDENSVLKSNFNRVLKDYNALENEFKEFEIKYKDLLSERESLLTQLSIKNESFISCKERCENLSQEMEDLREKIESCSQKQDKIWNRADWEEWTVLQTKLASTEKALLASRKQKSQLVAELKAMKSNLEASKDKILDAENAMNGLEWTLKRAQENNQLLYSENEELRVSLLKYEMNLLEMNRVAKQNAGLDKGTDTSEDGIGDAEKSIGSCEASVGCLTDGRHDEDNKELAVQASDAVIMRHVSKRSNARKAMTFPSNDFKQASIDYQKDDVSQPDVFADCHYQNAFQEVGGTSIETKTLVTEIEYPGGVELCSALDQPDKLAKKPKHQRNSKKCLSLKLLLPSVMQSILNSKAKRAKAPERRTRQVEKTDHGVNTEGNLKGIRAMANHDEVLLATKQAELQAEATEDLIGDITQECLSR